MDWKIEKIVFSNFKFFKDTFSIELAGKNLLLYGENGSGKSSIAMGLYTFIESRKKTMDGVLKYFTLGNDENLRNVYSVANDHSSISITYKNGSNNTETRTIGDQVIETQDRSDTFCQNSLAASDVISYRTLSELLYRKNSRKVDLFDLFVDDFFLFLDLDSPYQTLEGVIPDSTDLSAASWWKHLNEENITSDNYVQFNQLLASFKSKVSNELAIIQRFANGIIHDELQHPEISISLDLEITNSDSKNLKLVKPRLILTAKETNSEISGWSTTIYHLASHFNEARLTCIAIALRMAIAWHRHLSTPNINAFLCIDDLLISLDMGNRLLVIKMILARVNKWQLLILTHDKTLFEEFRRQIPENEQESDWLIAEMYIKDPSLSEHHYPEPFITDRKDYYDKAKAFLIQRDYPSCATNLRKYAEEQLCILLPTNLQLRKIGNKVIECDLNGLITSLRRYASELEIPTAVFPSLDFYRQRLLNPLSHNDIATPVYKNELENCFRELDKLPSLINNTFVLVANDETESKKWTISVSKDSSSDNLTFKSTETWVYLEYGGSRYIQNVQIEVCHNDSGLFHDHEKGKLNTIFDRLCDNLGYTTTKPLLKDCVSSDSGIPLSSIVGDNFREAVMNKRM